MISEYVLDLVGQWEDGYALNHGEAVDVARGLLAEIRLVQKSAREVARLLELGDQRLLAGDGPCGVQNAAVALLPEESAKLYQACKKITAGGANNG